MQQQSLSYDATRDREKTRLRVKKHRELKKAQAETEKARKIERETGFTIPQAHKATGFEAADIIKEWSESKLVVPTGPLIGQPIICHDYLYEWTGNALLDTTTEAGMSIARKNAKTGWIAVVDTCFLVGPLCRTNWRGVVASLNGKLALEMRAAIEQTAKAAHLSGLTVHRSPTPGIAYGRKGSQLDFLAADKGSGHAIGGDLAIIDEGGLMEENQRWLWNSIDSATSGRNGKLLVLSIQGTGPMFAEMEQRAESGDEPGLYWRRWAAKPEAEIDDRQAWHDANPGLAVGIKSEEWMAARAARALAVPLDQPAFRAQHLNQSISPGVQMICSLDEWKACQRRWSGRRAGPVIIGLDMGGSEAMTAGTIYYPETGEMEGYPVFPGSPDLKKRGKADGVGDLYVQMERMGDLTIQPGRRTPNIPLFLTDLFARIPEGAEILALVTDTYKKAEVLEKVYPWSRSHGTRIILRGTPKTQNATGAHDLKAFQAALKSRLAFKPSTAMLHAIGRSNIKMVGSNQDAPILGKVSQTSRIDLLQAAVLAVGVSAEMGFEETVEEAVEVQPQVSTIRAAPR